MEDEIQIKDYCDQMIFPLISLSSDLSSKNRMNRSFFTMICQYYDRSKVGWPKKIRTLVLSSFASFSSSTDFAGWLWTKTQGNIDANTLNKLLAKISIRRHKGNKKYLEKQLQKIHNKNNANNKQSKREKELDEQLEQTVNQLSMITYIYIYIYNYRQI